MNEPPALFEFTGDWESYEDLLYQEFLDTIVNRKLAFRGVRVQTQFRPAYRGKGFSFWHLTSEAPSPDNLNEAERIPDLERCRRIRWIAWVIENAGKDRFSWWENKRGSKTNVVIWAEDYDFAVILAKRRGYYLLKTAYCLQERRKRTFERERDEYRRTQKTKTP